MRNNNARHGYTIVGHGYLTRGDGTGTFIADQNNRMGFYWQQSDDGNQRIVGIATVDDSIVFENNRDYEKFAVDLGYKPNDSKLYILGQNSYGMNTGGGSTINERKIAELAQGIKLPLAVTADKTQPSLKVFINSWTPAIAGTGVTLFPITEVNLTDYIPSSSNQMCYAAIFIQSDYATIEITTSTPRSTSGLPLSRNDLNEAVAAATAGDTAVYAVKLVNGQTTITQSDLNNNGWPLQPYVSLATSSGGGSGSVTSVALTVPARQTVAGSPITTSGTLAITDNNQSANKFLGGPTTGSPAAPDYRALVTSDLPSGVGDVVGPSSAVNNDLAAFDTTTGKLIKDSGLTTANAGKAIAALADKFLLQTPDTTNLPNAQAMSALATGLVKNTTGTGVQSIAAAGTDYLAPAAIGVTVEAHSTELDTIAGLSPTNGNFLKRVTGAWAAVNIAASDILSGLLALGRGGTHADLSATGPGFLKQATSGADVTVTAVDLSTSDATGTLAAGRFPALTGDVTTSAGALATTLATVNGNVGTFSRVKSVTVNAKGLITAITQGLVDLASEVTGLLPLANGGSGADLSGTGPGVLVQASASAVVTVPSALGINYLADAYKLSVSVAIASNTTIANPGTATFDGITLSAGDRTLLFGQSTASQNGIWVFNGSSSALTRPTDFASGSALFVYRNVVVLSTNGTNFGGLFWRMTSAGTITIDTSAQSWTAIPINLTNATHIPVMAGDGGSGGTAGAVPAPAAGDAIHALFGDATFVGTSRKLVDLTVLGADAANIDLTSIPGTYKHLMLELELRSDRAAQTTDNAYIRLNNDSTAADYYSYSVHMNGTTPTFSVLERLAVTATGIECNLSTTAATAPANEYGYFQIWIYNYASVANNRKVEVKTLNRSGTTSGNLRQIFTAGWWLNTAAAVSRITILPVNGSNWKAGSSYMLYGFS